MTRRPGTGVREWFWDQKTSVKALDSGVSDRMGVIHFNWRFVLEIGHSFLGTSGGHSLHRGSFVFEIQDRGSFISKIRIHAFSTYEIIRFRDFRVVLDPALLVNVGSLR